MFKCRLPWSQGNWHLTGVGLLLRPWITESFRAHPWLRLSEELSAMKKLFRMSSGGKKVSIVPKVLSRARYEHRW